MEEKDLGYLALPLVVGSFADFYVQSQVRPQCDRFFGRVQAIPLLHIERQLHAVAEHLLSTVHTRLQHLIAHRIVAIYFMFYNWIRIHKTLRVTPAMAAGLTNKLMSMEDVVAMIDAVAAKPDRPKLYKKRTPQISN